MDNYSRINEKGFHQFLDLIPNEKREQPLEIKEETTSHEFDKSLELRLGPPGENFNTPCARNQQALVQNARHVLQLQRSQQGLLPVMKREPSHPCNVREPSGMHGGEKKASSSTAVQNSKKRTAPSSVVGWPPVRTARKNLASSGGSSRRSPLSESETAGPVEERKLPEGSTKNALVKINMDGIPIGRKFDLKACGSYEKLSRVVDKLFRWILEAQTGTAFDANTAFRGLLDGSGKYALVYEDNEGDKMVVGDVPWNMFVSTVKRLRVSKRSEISTLSLARGKALS